MAEFHVNTLEGQDSPRRLRKGIHSLPEDLDQMYQKSLESVAEQARQNKKRAFEVLSWVAYAGRSLSTQQLQHAIAATQKSAAEDDIKEEDLPNLAMLIQSCAGLVTVEKGNSTIRLVNHTAQAFLAHFEDTEFLRARANLGLSCVAYLSLSAFDSGPLAQSGSPIRPATPDTLEHRKDVYTFFSYASNFWQEHVRGDGESTVAEALAEFLANLKRLCSVV